MSQDVTFGQIIKERRSILGFTQAELARQSGCAAVTVRKIEADALRPSVQLASLLAAALQIDPKELPSFVQLARGDIPRTPLPAPSPRATEIGLPDLTGRAVKGYQLSEQIGSGGFGVVYRARQPSVDRDVAIKIIFPRFANHPTFIRRFEAEAYLVARLEHPHIVPLYDFWREPHAAYLVMRLLRRGSLADRLKEGRLSIAETSTIATQIGAALAMAHGHGVVHRDIKPANILLDERGNGYLADFGIAKDLGPQVENEIIATGPLIGSPAYISPEQIQNEQIGPHTDIYCFGLLLYEMLTGEKAFKGPTQASYIQQHLNELPHLLRSTHPNLPQGLDDVIQRATAKKPADRYADIEALLVHLTQVWGGASLGFDAGLQTLPYLRPEEVDALENPYCGLRAFGEADAPNFFGREGFVDTLLERMADKSDLERFVAVVGPSGSGKSSVVKAGLIPAIRQGKVPGSDRWFVVDITPGEHPWEEIEIALLRIAVNPPEQLLNQLLADSRGLLRAVRRALPPDEGSELLLVIDQFEEIFTLTRDETVRTHFLESLVLAVLDPRSRLRVIITMRADFTDRPLQYVDFGELFMKRLALMLPLSADEITRVIRNPLISLGMEIEPELITTMVSDVGEQPGMLPLLQYSLTELFERRSGQTLTLEDYGAVGGVIGSLALRADMLYETLDNTGKRSAR
ncbi:MAG: protein kinase, partial [Chloroflexota bacterium]